MAKIKQDIGIVGANISRLRNEFGYTQDQMVAKMQLEGCNITRTTYSKKESGNYHIKDSELLVIQSIFKVHFDEFFKTNER